MQCNIMRFTDERQFDLGILSIYRCISFGRNLYWEFRWLSSWIQSHQKRWKPCSRPCLQCANVESICSIILNLKFIRADGFAIQMRMLILVHQCAQNHSLLCLKYPFQQPSASFSRTHDSQRRNHQIPDLRLSSSKPWDCRTDERKFPK